MVLGLIIISSLLHHADCLKDWPRAKFRSGSPVLRCAGRFYKGYNLARGDSGQVVLSPGQSSDLCLFKFYPASDCQLKFSCESFSVSPGYSATSCPTKLITKPDQKSAERWCGSQTPPSSLSPLTSSAPLMVGYLSLSLHTNPGPDNFRCRISCVANTGGVGGGGGGGGGGGQANCQCGRLTGRRRKKKLKNFQSKPKRSLSSAMTGRSMSGLSRIVGGVSAPAGSVPWQVSLAVSGSIFCGGTLLTDRHTLTAAHCLAGVETNLYSMVDILLAEYDTTDTTVAVRRKIRKVVLHPEFNEETLQNDIAVITMRRPVSVGPGSRMVPVCLPPANFNPPVNSVATVTGFGTTSESSDQPSSRLLAVEVNIISNSACSAMNSVYGSKLVPSMMCAGVVGGGRDACKRDSGGPLTQTSPAGQTSLLGVVSWGQGCAEAAFPGVYTRVAAFTPWVLQQIQAGRQCRG